MNYVELKASEVTCVVGDNTSHEEHRAGYNGLWSLQSVHEPINLFVPAYVGLNLEHIFDGSAVHTDRKRYFEPRNRPMQLSMADGAATLYQEPTPHTGVESWTTFRVEEPNRIRFRFRASPGKSDYRFGYLGFFWASYIFCPENKSIYFTTPGDGPQGWRWYQHCTLAHSRDSSVLHVNDAVEVPVEKEEHVPLYSVSTSVRYLRPFYYGLRGKMALIYVFEKYDGVLRFCHSPSGGGSTPDSMDTCPAWDFFQVISNPEAGRTYELALTAIYKRYQGRSDILRQVQSVIGS